MLIEAILAEKLEVGVIEQTKVVKLSGQGGAFDVDRAAISQLSMTSVRSATVFPDARIRRTCDRVRRRVPPGVRRS